MGSSEASSLSLSSLPRRTPPPALLAPLNLHASNQRTSQDGDGGQGQDGQGEGKRTHGLFVCLSG